MTSAADKPGRNDACPCGSGKKYKRCCAVQPPAGTPAQRLTPAAIGALVSLVDQERLSEAEREVRLLLRAHPDAGMLWKILGVAQLRQGRDALTALRKTTELLPQDAEAHANLGAALHDRGLWEEALESLRRALSIQPNLVEALVHAANAERALGRPQASVAMSRRAVALDPARADSQYSLGNALFDCRQFAEAGASYARVIELQPRFAPAHLGLAVVLRAQHRHAEAVSSCQAALALDANYVEALTLLGDLRADEGRFAESEYLFQRAIDINPDFAFAFAGLATHRKMSADDTRWLAGAEALLVKPLPPEHEISLRFALGKYFDDIGRYDEAFGHYREANELGKRLGAPYDGQKLQRRVSDIKRSFDADFMHRCRPWASSSDLPVFIVGMPRSGTSLTEHILASHPAVFGAGEVTFWDSACSRILEAEAGRTSGTKGCVESIPSVARDYLDRLTTFSGTARRVVDKMPANFLYAGLIHALFPQARIIHMRRHPLDNCLSIYFQNFLHKDPHTQDLGNLAHYYGEYRTITDHWRSLLPAAVWLDVPYEGLIEDQEGWTRRMIEFIGLPWDDHCLHFERTDRVVITASKWQVRQKLYDSSVARWRNYEQHIGPLRGLKPETDFSRDRAVP